MAWEINDLPLPSSYVYIVTNISDIVYGGGFYDNMLTVRYANNGYRR